MRRALRHGNRLGAHDPFFYHLVAPLVQEMGAAYPELARAQAQVEQVLKLEEERFAETLSQGLRILDQDIAALAGTEISGATAFKLYDTYGFPVDLTADIARERGLTVDMAGFEREMDAQRERARAAMTFKAGAAGHMGDIAPSEFRGYESLREQATVRAIRVEQKPVEELRAGQTGIVFLDRTPFYAESGGQVGDQGVLRNSEAEFAVSDTQKSHAHVGQLTRGVLRVGDRVDCEVDCDKRLATANNHSATHLLHAALKQVLGAHVAQKGSLVTPERLRFDFAHFAPLTPEQWLDIEERVNRVVRANEAVQTRVMPLEQAMSSGAVALFGEKYAENVRVVGMGEFSTELCGGTHVSRTGDIGVFKIIAEGGVAAGVRRIEAVTGAGALAYMRETEARLQRIADLVRGNRDDVERKVEQLNTRVRSLEKELSQLQGKLATGAGTDLASQAQTVNGAQVLAARLDGADVKGLRETVDRMKDKLGSAAIVLASVQEQKITLIAGITKDLVGRLHAGELANHVAQRVGGKGGGRPDMAQAGGNDPAQLDAALADVSRWVAQNLAS